MQIRTARKEDYGQIYRLVQTAFSTAQVSDGTEQDFVLELRRRPGYIPGLELAAEESGRLVGHIMLTEQTGEWAGSLSRRPSRRPRKWAIRPFFS